MHNYGEQIAIRDRKMDQDDALYWARVVGKGLGHGGYVWYAVTDDGELLCATCVRENWRQIVASTREHAADGWEIIGVTHSGEVEEPENCAHCGKELSWIE